MRSACSRGSQCLEAIHALSVLIANATAFWSLQAFSGRLWVRDWYQFGQLPKSPFSTESAKRRHRKRPPTEAASWHRSASTGQVAGPQLFLTLVVLGALGGLAAPVFHNDPPPVHTPPAQLPLPFIRSAKAALVRAIELKNATDKVIAKIFISISSDVAPYEGEHHATKLGHRQTNLGH